VTLEGVYTKLGIYKTADDIEEENPEIEMDDYEPDDFGGFRRV